MTARKALRSGYSTGACAAAAAAGATALLLGRWTETIRLELPWEQPDAEPVAFRLVNRVVEDGTASCGVVKSAGDDPDVTDGVEIRAAASWCDTWDRDAVPVAVGPHSVGLRGGRGVGRVTKPGLAVPVGEPAINPVPRRMIAAAVEEALTRWAPQEARTLQVEVSVPRGRELARHTLNERLGIVGGLSILGTTGIVVPMSAHAWCATIDAGLDVARASGLGRVVLSHGRSSENAARHLFPDLPEEGFILMGDHVGYALEAVSKRNLHVIVAGQFAKFCKVAAGCFETHVKDSTLNMQVVADLLEEAGFSPEQVQDALRANTARQVFQQLLENGDRGVFRALARRVWEQVRTRLPGSRELEVLLFGYDKALVARFP